MLDELKQVMVGGSGRPGHGDLAGAVDGCVRAEFPPGDGCRLAAGGGGGEFGVEQAAVAGEAAALPAVGDRGLSGDRGGQGR